MKELQPDNKSAQIGRATKWVNESTDENNEWSAELFCKIQ